MPDNKTIVRDYLEQVWTKRNRDAIDQHISAAAWSKPGGSRTCLG
jgi:hypothetical protein